MDDLKQLRKMLIWGLPLYLSIIIFALWFFIWIALPEILNAIGLAPTVRIWLGWMVFPPASFFLAAILLAVVAKAFSWKAVFVKAQKATLPLLAVTSLVFLVTVPFGSSIHSFFLAKRGYTECEILKGHPTVWFSDWVRSRLVRER